MTPFKTSRTFLQEAIKTFAQLIDTSRWVVQSMFSKEGNRYMLGAVCFYIIGNLLEQLAPLFLGKLVAAHTAGKTGLADTYLYYTGGVWVVGIVLERIGHRLREWGWNANTRSVLLQLSAGWFAKTPGEIAEEDRDVGANQIESGVHKMDEVQHAIFFDFTEVAISLITILLFVSWSDTGTGGGLLLILSLNVGVMFLMNHYMHVRMVTIDRNLRRLHNRLIELWHNAVFVIAGARVEPTLSWLEKHSYEVYWDDYQLWGKWFPIVDGIRSILTNVALLVIVWCNYATWDTETLVAITGWLALFRMQLWRIGNIQRTLTKQTERLHALREAFAEPPRFNQARGIVYQKGD